MLWITYPKGGKQRGATKPDVLGEITSVTRCKPVALLAIDDKYTPSASGGRRRVSPRDIVRR